jgi:CPA1 family monovalent cation:H+ antiporter
MIGTSLAMIGSHGLVSEAVELTMTLLLIAAAVGVATRIVRIPYTVALVVVGLVIALFKLAPPDAKLSQDLVLVLFLPPLLFQAGLHLDLQHLRRAWLSVLLLAVPGVLLTTCIVAAGIYTFLPESLTESHHAITLALLFGALLATTDPISVLAAFRSAGVPQRLKTIVEGESLFNDGTGVVLFVLLFTMLFPQGVLDHGGDAAAPTEAHATLVAPDGIGVVRLIQDEPPIEPPDERPAPSDETTSPTTPAPDDATPATGASSDGFHLDDVKNAGIEFLKVVGIGILAGLVLGLGCMAVLRFINDHTLETAITIVLAWGSFLFVEYLHGSGVIAVVVIGLVMGNYGRNLSMSEETRLTVEGFWDAIAFVVNSLVFLLIGTELQDVGPAAFLSITGVIIPAIIAFLALLVSRGLQVYPIAWLYRHRWDPNWKHVIFWSGLKGSIPIALVLGMPEGPLRDFLLPVIFVVVLISLVLQGSTMPLLISFLGCGVDDEGRRPAAPEPAGPNEPEPDDRTAPIDEAERIPPAPLENRVTETVIISRADLLGDDESEPRTIVDPIEEEDPEKTGLIEIEIPDEPIREPATAADEPLESGSTPEPVPDEDDEQGPLDIVDALSEDDADEPVERFRPSFPADAGSNGHDEVEDEQVDDDDLPPSDGGPPPPRNGPRPGPGGWKRTGE